MPKEARGEHAEATATVIQEAQLTARPGVAHMLLVCNHAGYKSEGRLVAGF